MEHPPRSLNPKKCIDGRVIKEPCVGRRVAFGGKVLLQRVRGRPDSIITTQYLTHPSSLTCYGVTVFVSETGTATIYNKLSQIRDVPEPSTNRNQHRKLQSSRFLIAAINVRVFFFEIPYLGESTTPIPSRHTCDSSGGIPESGHLETQVSC